MTRGILVSGTGTGVGKTVVAAGLLRLLARRGLPRAAWKPVASGVPPHDDAELLRAAAADGDSLDAVNPLRYAEPLAPAVAADRCGRPADPAALRRALAARGAGGRFVVAEGAGGLLVPIAWGWSLADLAREEGLPVLLVGRAALGALHDGAAAAEAARARGLRVLGFVLARLEDRPDGAAEETNPAALARLTGLPVWGVLPRLAPAAARDPDALADAVATLDLAPFWKEADPGHA